MPGARIAGFLLIVLGSAATLAAQSDPPPLPGRPIAYLAPLPDDSISASQRLLVLQRWTQAYADWQAWHERWGNRLEPGWLSTRPRREAPVPPAWLPAACAVALEDEGPLADACRALRDWSRRDDFAEALTQQTAQARTNLEAPRNTRWWERVHVDGLWPMTQSGATAFGVIGMHTTLHVTKRFQVFLVPGVILMRVPSLDGAQTWSAATDWGFSYGLFDFRVPGLRRVSTVHLNTVRVWVLSAESNPIHGEQYLAGLSLTFRQR